MNQNKVKEQRFVRLFDGGGILVIVGAAFLVFFDAGNVLVNVLNRCENIGDYRCRIVCACMCVCGIKCFVL